MIKIVMLFVLLCSALSAADNNHKEVGFLLYINNSRIYVSEELCVQPCREDLIMWINNTAFSLGKWITSRAGKSATRVPLDRWYYVVMKQVSKTEYMTMLYETEQYRHILTIEVSGFSDQLQQSIGVNHPLNFGKVTRVDAVLL